MIDFKGGKEPPYASENRWQKSNAAKLKKKKGNFLTSISITHVAKWLQLYQGTAPARCGAGKDG